MFGERKLSTAIYISDIFHMWSTLKTVSSRPKLMQEVPQILMALCNQPIVSVYLIRSVHRWKGITFYRWGMFV